MHQREKREEIDPICQMLTSYLGLWDEQLSPPGGRGSCEERKEEKEG